MPDGLFEDVLLQAYELGASEFINKPFTTQYLSSVVLGKIKDVIE